MYKLNSGFLALREQIRRNALPKPEDQIPVHKRRATFLRMEGDDIISHETVRRMHAARRLANETARKTRENVELKLEYLEEQEEAKRRAKMLKMLQGR